MQDPAVHVQCGEEEPLPLARPTLFGVRKRPPCTGTRKAKSKVYAEAERLTCTGNWTCEPTRRRISELPM